MPRHTDPVRHIYSQVRRQRRAAMAAQFAERLRMLDDLATDTGAELIAAGRTDDATLFLEGVASTQAAIVAERDAALARLDASDPDRDDAHALAESMGLVG